MKRKMSKIYTPYPAYFFLFFILLYTTNLHANVISSSPNTPVKIIDGDSLEIGNYRIRLIGIDAPEYEQHCKDSQNKKYFCGQTSIEYLQKLIGNNTITCKIHHKDKYDRELCTCFKGKIDLNAEMVRSGNALTYLDSNYQKEQTKAKEEKRGIWQGKFMHPRLFRQLKQHQKNK